MISKEKKNKALGCFCRWIKIYHFYCKVENWVYMTEKRKEKPKKNHWVRWDDKMNWNESFKEEAFDVQKEAYFLIEILN